jgi:cold shock CspA family protein
MSVLKRSGLPSLLAEQPVRMMVVTTPKGREARQIWLL